MKERTWTIGSSPDCDVRAESATVSGRHCRLSQHGHTFILEDLGSTNGTFVAGQRIERPRNVCRGDKIMLGQSTPMPWPNLSSITVGRLPDNDVVIPLDVVSGHHARLEREGNRVLLIDMDSRNGTALNDPLNKIRRAVMQPGDVVFLGTYQVAAAELLAALPEEQPDPGQARQATRFEATPFVDPGVRHSPTAPEVPLSGFGRSWVRGFGLGAACILVVVAAAWAVRTGWKEKSFDPKQAEPRTTPTVTTPAVAEPLPRVEPRTSAVKPVPRVEPEFNEQLIRQSEKGIYLLSFRVGRGVYFTCSTAWAISPDKVIGPTASLKSIDSMLIKGDKLDSCIVVCNPLKTLRVMKHSPGEGDGALLSICQLEAPAESVSFEMGSAASFGPVPGQKLAMLVARGGSASKDRGDPAKVSAKLISLVVDQIQRDARNAPTAFYCTAAENPGVAVAAPVFEGHGIVVGCVEWASNSELHVVPISRITVLSRAMP